MGVKSTVVLDRPAAEFLLTQYLEDLKEVTVLSNEAIAALLEVLDETVHGDLFTNYQVH